MLSGPGGDELAASAAASADPEANAVPAESWRNRRRVVGMRVTP
jgi:hypothetical protein